MTDNEIVKIFECCYADKPCQECLCYINDKCTREEDVYVLPRKIVDLIKRQQAEIERYEKENNEKFNKWLLLDERTKNRYAELYEEAKGVVRAEAIKEFVERLKKSKMEVDVSYGYGKESYTEAVAVVEIDRIARELIEDEGK